MERKSGENEVPARMFLPLVAGVNALTGWCALHSDERVAEHTLFLKHECAQNHYLCALAPLFSLYGKCKIRRLVRLPKNGYAILRKKWSRCARLTLNYGRAERNIAPLCGPNAITFSN